MDISKHPLLESTSVTTAAAVALGALAAWWYFRSSADNCDKRLTPAKRLQATQPTTITQLWMYPIKSCRGSSVMSVDLLPRGFRFDREWIIIRRRDTHVITIRDSPRAMSSLRASVSSGHLLVEWEGTGAEPWDGKTHSISISISRDDRHDASAEAFINVSLWELDGVARDEGVDAARFFSHYLGDDVLLARTVQPRNPLQCESHGIRVDGDNTRIRFQDLSPLSLVTEEGLSHLNAAIPLNSTPAPVDCRRFRPNIVVRGVPFPLEESWETMQLVSEDVTTELRTVKLCDRCSIPGVDPATGSRYSEPRKYLQTFHSAKHLHVDNASPKPIFGLCVNHRVRSGDPVPTDDQTVMAIISVGDSIQATQLRELPSYEPVVGEAI